MTSALVTCPGCGSVLPAVDGPVHDYMTSSPACWASFSAILAQEYATPALMPIQWLSVDTWAVQHPGDGSRRAIQSVGLHLARLMRILEDGLDAAAANAEMQAFASRRTTLPELPPRPGYAVTIADVPPTDDPTVHRAAVEHWARATWDAWRDQHATIRARADNMKR
ncbi:DUF5946 family protein [Sphingomonas floccifaciens]|uniref:DUF5946 family protein n=1 Tax=Sphingomonas floccifaciens TaxID=1844115 RepID=A0ABW4ND97_9SPHN